MVVATESSIFFVDGGFAKDGTQFSAVRASRCLVKDPWVLVYRLSPVLFGALFRGFLAWINFGFRHLLHLVRA